eukprot:14046787-Alexandrium_andersonii.AAC.1
MSASLVGSEMCIRDSKLPLSLLRNPALPSGSVHALRALVHTVRMDAPSNDARWRLQQNPDRHMHV